MKKVVLTYGLISGLIVAVMVWVNSALVFEKKIISMDKSELMGYATMVIALSLIFFGIKSYRDNYSKGAITFWKGVQIGLLISAVASVLYFGGAEFYNIANPAFKDKFVEEYSQYQADKMKANGATPEQLDQAKKNVEMMKGFFENPLIFFGVCVIEIFPVGLVITLICAAILRKKEVLPTAANVAISVS